MKTKEFIRRVEDLGFTVEILIDENPLSKTFKKDSIIEISCDDVVVAKVWMRATYALNTVNDQHMFFHYKYDMDALYELCFEYVKTPVWAREEEKKFYLKHRWMGSDDFAYLTLHNDMCEYLLSSIMESDYYKTSFTLKEIKNIKEKFNTDLKDFELIEV